MKPLKLTQFSDPGHGWLAVKRKLIKQLGIENRISGCSYQRGQTVYLEEDCDVGVFLKAYFGEIPSQWWTQVELKKSYTNGSSPIRNYESFKAGA